VIWLIRGGALVGSMLSAMPAWQMIDPLPVLHRGGGRCGSDVGPADIRKADGRAIAMPAGQCRPGAQAQSKHATSGTVDQGHLRFSLLRSFVD